MASQKQYDETAAMHFIAMQTETQRLTNNWPRILRTSLWPNLDSVFVAVAAHACTPLAVSLELKLARQFRDNLTKCIEAIEKGEHRKGGGYPPDGIPHRDN